MVAKRYDWGSLGVPGLARTPPVEAAGPDFKAAGPDFEAGRPDFEAAGQDSTDVSVALQARPNRGPGP